MGYNSEDACKDLKDIAEKLHNDTETAHAYSDDVLCKLLQSLGYNEVVDLYNDIDKWYA